MSVRPIGFDRHCAEALFRNEPLRYLGALAVKLMRAMRRFSDQDELCLADELEQAVIIVARPM